MAKLLQVGTWIFDPDDVKAIKMGASGSATLHIPGCGPIELNKMESTAFLGHYGKGRSALVIGDPVIQINWNVPEAPMRVTGLDLHE